MVVAADSVGAGDALRPEPRALPRPGGGRDVPPAHLPGSHARAGHRRGAVAEVDRWRPGVDGAGDALHGGGGLRAEPDAPLAVGGVAAAHVLHPQRIRGLRHALLRDEADRGQGLHLAGGGDDPDERLAGAADGDEAAGRESVRVPPGPAGDAPLQPDLHRRRQDLVQGQADRAPQQQQRHPSHHHPHGGAGAGVQQPAGGAAHTHLPRHLRGQWRHLALRARSGHPLPGGLQLSVHHRGLGRAAAHHVHVPPRDHQVRARVRGLGQAGAHSLLRRVQGRGGVARTAQADCSSI
mmetsp:Transcript_6421/g.13044  ORF Transcript_6421/g.13044 Transcript_6421/m.13044 type:complete len:294 (+) Transcript_6421:727-1608(+)